MVMATLWKLDGNLSSSIATIMVDRRSVPNSSLGSIYIDITQSAGNFVASASDHHLAIEILGEGQGIATIKGFVIDMGP